EPWEREHLARTGAPAPGTTSLLPRVATSPGRTAFQMHPRGRARCSRSQEDRPACDVRGQLANNIKREAYPSLRLDDPDFPEGRGTRLRGCRPPRPVPRSVRPIGPSRAEEGGWSGSHEAVPAGCLPPPPRRRQVPNDPDPGYS